MQRYNYFWNYESFPIIIICSYLYEMMPAASDKGSQPYSRAVMYGEMAGKR